jgi:hypothetical protein
MGGACSKDGEIRNAYSFWLENLKGRDHLEDLDVKLTNSVEQNLLEKLIVSHLIKKCSLFYGTRMIINVFKTASHWSLS